MTTPSAPRFIRLGAAKALTRGGPDPGIEINLIPGWMNTPLTLRVTARR